MDKKDMKGSSRFAEGNAVMIRKEIGETPLEALERYRAAQIAAGRTELIDAPMTYAGRLDPMAEGELLILISDECRNKERWLGLDKEYEAEIVFGIETDTYDALGLAVLGHSLPQNPRPLEVYIGKFRQEYPPYSSKMFSWKGDEPPVKEVEIYSLEFLSSGRMDAADLRARIFSMIDRVKGNFRQEEITHRWNEILDGRGSFPTMRIRVRCSSGTYMRSLAQRMGKEAGSAAFALSIKRTAIIFDKSGFIL